MGGKRNLVISFHRCFHLPSLKRVASSDTRKISSAQMVWENDSFWWKKGRDLAIELGKILRSAFSIKGTDIQPIYQHS